MRASFVGLIALPAAVAAQLLGLPHRIVTPTPVAPYTTVRPAPAATQDSPDDNIDAPRLPDADVVTDDEPDATTTGVVDGINTPLTAIPGLLQDTDIDGNPTQTTDLPVDTSLTSLEASGYTTTAPLLPTGESPAAVPDTVSPGLPASAPRTRIIGPTHTTVQPSRLVEPMQPSGHTLSAEQRTAISIGVVAALGITVALIALRGRLFSSARRQRLGSTGSRTPQLNDSDSMKDEPVANEKTHYAHTNSVRPTSLPVPAHFVDAQRWDLLQYGAIHQGWSAQPGDIISSRSERLARNSDYGWHSPSKGRWSESY